MDLPLIVSASIAIGHLIRRFLPDPIVKGLLFDGEIEAGHKTKFALQQYVERYKDSVGTMNVCFTLNVAFAVLALYAYFGLADGSTIKIPFIDLSISRKQWITLCPIISYGLQAYIFVTLVWFLVLRRGLRLLIKEVGSVEYFGDVSNILLTGFVGILWMLTKIFLYFRTQWHYLWFTPLLLMITAVAFSPIILCAYFIIALFQIGEVILPIIYSVLFIPSIVLSALLMILGAVLGIGEMEKQTELRV